MVKLKEEKGITLIVLAITVTILIILAGVTIRSIIGENGIIEQAGQAKDETNEATLKEELNSMITLSCSKNGIFNVENFKKRATKQNWVIEQETETQVTVEKYEFKAIIDKNTGEII